MTHARLGLIAMTAVLGLQARPAADDPKVTFVDHVVVAKGGTVVSRPDLIVMTQRRAATGQSELHEKETDTFYVLSGSATFITGGEMVGAKPTAPGQQRGTSIKGGTVHHLTKGDVIVIPAGTPHWFKDVPGPFEYYVVKVLKP